MNKHLCTGITWLAFAVAAHTSARADETHQTCGDPTDGGVQNSCESLVSPDLIKVLGTTADLPITNKISIPGGPDWIGIGYNSVWVKTSSQVLKINQSTNKLEAKIDAATCRGFGMGFQKVWTTDCGNGAILAIDPTTNKVTDTIKVKIDGSGEGSIGVGEGAIWAISSEGGTSSGMLVRVDPASKKVVAKIRISDGSNGVTVAGGSVWVTGTTAGTLTKINPLTDKVEAVIKVHDSPRFVTSDATGVWVLNQGDGTVSRIDPATSKVVATIDAGAAGGGGDIKAGEGGIWVTMPGKPVIRIDPQSNKVSHVYSGSAGDALNVGYGSVWLPAYGSGGSEIWRIDAKKASKPGTPSVISH